MVINISERRYKLHLTSEQLDLINRVLDDYDWFCDCDDFPKCKDFKMFQKLKSRLKNLVERSIYSRFAGHESHRKLHMKYIIEGRNI